MKTSVPIWRILTSSLIHYIICLRMQLLESTTKPLLVGVIPLTTFANLIFLNAVRHKSRARWSNMSSATVLYKLNDVQKVLLMLHTWFGSVWLQLALAPPCRDHPPPFHYQDLLLTTLYSFLDLKFLFVPLLVVPNFLLPRLPPLLPLGEEVRVTVLGLLWTPLLVTFVSHGSREHVDRPLIPQMFASQRYNFCEVIKMTEGNVETAWQKKV